MQTMSTPTNRLAITYRSEGSPPQEGLSADPENGISKCYYFSYYIILQYRTLYRPHLDTIYLSNESPHPR